MPASRPSPALALDALRRRWRAMFGRMPPAALSKEQVQLYRCKPDLPEVRWRQKRMRQRSVWDNEGRADPLEVGSPVFGDDFSCSAQLAASSPALQPLFCQKTGT